jgi:hypothetical protein
MAVQSLAAAGSDQAGAGAITGGIVAVTGADGTKGVRLPTGAAESQCWVYNTHASNVLKLYPHTGGAFNNGTSNAAINVAGRTSVHCLCVDGTNWLTIS